MARHDTSAPWTRDSIPDRVPRAWTLWKAARPSQLVLVCLVYALGVGMVAAGFASPDDPGPLDAEATVAAVGGLAALLPAAAAIHYANEYADYETDALTDRTPFSGGSGALHRTGLERRFLSVGLVSVLVVGTATTVAVAVLVGLPVAALGLLVGSTALGLAYSLPPVALVRRGGLGEVTNAVLGGFTLPLYGVAVVAPPGLEHALAVVPFTLVVACNLLATHWPDREADAAVGKRTLAVQWSPDRLRTAYAVLAVTAAVIVIVLAGRVLPVAVALAHLPALPFLAWGGAVLTRQRSPFPAVAAMVVLAASTTIAWWGLALGLL